MIKDYCKASISWKPKITGGYGTTYGVAVVVDNVYFQPSIKLVRGQDNTSASGSMFICYDNIGFVIGDYIEHAGRGYTITGVSSFYKPRTDVFDHLEIELQEVNNG